MQLYIYFLYHAIMDAWFDCFSSYWRAKPRNDNLKCV